jgi:GNAT superfamily N-acetyltransferase
MSGSEILSLTLPGTLPDEWYDLARRVFAGDPRWIPEHEPTLARHFAAQHFWFDSGRAHAFLVPEKARIAVYFQPDRQLQGKSVAYFGDFVSTGDAAVEDALFERAEAWARAQGASELHGPMHFSTWYTYRVLVSMEEGGLPFPGEPYDTPGTHLKFERRGYAQVQRYQSRFHESQVFPSALQRFLPGAQRALDLGYTINAEGKQGIIDFLPGFYDRAMSIFRDAYAFSAPPKDVWLDLTHTTLRRTCPRTTMIVRDPAGEVAGYILTMPDWSPLVVQGCPDRVDVDDLDYELHAHRLAPLGAIIYKTMGVLPAHQNAGLAALMMAEILRKADGHYGTIVGATMREDNKSRTFGNGIVTYDRWYALYGRALA